MTEVPESGSPRARAATLSAWVAFVSALGPVYMFHHHRGPVTIWVSLVFGALAAAVAFFAVASITRKRWMHVTPVLGARRGAGAALATFMLTLFLHVCVYAGEGPLWIMLLLTLGMGIVLLGWVVALIGAAVGIYCEKTYFESTCKHLENTVY